MAGASACAAGTSAVAARRAVASAILSGFMAVSIGGLSCWGRTRTTRRCRSYSTVILPFPSLALPYRRAAPLGRANLWSRGHRTAPQRSSRPQSAGDGPRAHRCNAERIPLALKHSRMAGKPSGRSQNAACRRHVETPMQHEAKDGRASMCGERLRVEGVERREGWTFARAGYPCGCIRPPPRG